MYDIGLPINSLNLLLAVTDGPNPPSTGDFLDLFYQIKATEKERLAFLTKLVLAADERGIFMDDQVTARHDDFAEADEFCVEFPCGVHSVYFNPSSCIEDLEGEDDYNGPPHISWMSLGTDDSCSQGELQPDLPVLQQLKPIVRRIVDKALADYERDAGRAIHCLRSLRKAGINVFVPVGYEVAPR